MYSHTVICIRCNTKFMAEKSRRTHLCRPCQTEHSHENRLAVAKVQRNVNLGILPRANQCTCVDCGKKARIYEHRDYTKPLDVVPVCTGCNTRRGVALDSKLRFLPPIQLIPVDKRLGKCVYHKVPLLQHIRDLMTEFAKPEPMELHRYFALMES